MIVRSAIQQNPGGATPRDGSSDRSGGCQDLRGECAMLTNFHCPSESWELRNPQTSAHLPGTAPGPHNGVVPGGIVMAVSKGLFNDTDVVAVVASPRSAVEVTGNRIHCFVKHHCSNRKDQLLSDATLLGVIVVDVQRSKTISYETSSS